MINLFKINFLEICLACAVLKLKKSGVVEFMTYSKLSSMRSAVTVLFIVSCLLKEKYFSHRRSIQEKYFSVNICSFPPLNNYSLRSIKGEIVLHFGATVSCTSSYAIRLILEKEFSHCDQQERIILSTRKNSCSFSPLNDSFLRSVNE